MRKGDSWENRLRLIAHVRDACHQAGIRFWTEYEIFDFVRQGERNVLRPCGIERLKWQLPPLPELTERIVVCGVPGIMEDRNLTHPRGDERVWRMFEDYRNEFSGNT